MTLIRHSIRHRGLGRRQELGAYLLGGFRAAGRLTREAEGLGRLLGRWVASWGLGGGWVGSWRPVRTLRPRSIPRLIDTRSPMRKGAGRPHTGSRPVASLGAVRAAPTLAHHGHEVSPGGDCQRTALLLSQQNRQDPPIVLPARIAAA